MSDKYKNFEELQANENMTSYNIYAKKLTPSIAVIAPHGGGIEGGTSELTLQLGEDFSFYLFEAAKSSGNTDLHITSTNFDEPIGVNLVSYHDNIVSIHGYASSVEGIKVGGTDRQRAELIANKLQEAGFSAVLLAEDDRLAGTNPENIANRNRTGNSVQLELSTALRKAMFDTFTAKERKNTKNAKFYQFVDTLKTFISENY